MINHVTMGPASKLSADGRVKSVDKGSIKSIDERSIKAISEASFQFIENDSIQSLGVEYLMQVALEGSPKSPVPHSIVEYSA